MPLRYNSTGVHPIAVMPELPPFHNPPPDSDVAPFGDTLPAQAGYDYGNPPQPERDRWQGARSLAAWILRWALLGVGVGGAWFLGILVAQFFPAANPAAPVQEVVVRRTHRFTQKVRRLPEWWAGDSYRPAPTAAPLRLQTEPTAPPPTTRPITLSDAQREQIAVELEAVQEELQRLRDRTSALETQLNLPPAELPVEERLTGIANRLSPPTDPPQATDPPAPAQPPSTPPPDLPDPLFQVDAYRVTLPSDVLFVPGESILQTNAQPLLDSILLDVGRYPGATILVGSYTDTQVGDGTPTDLSYKQAMAIQRYLSQQLGDENYHWVTVGYGNSPLGTAGGSQLSRRVTIAIVP